MGKKTKIPNPRTGSTIFASLPDIGNLSSPHCVHGGDIFLLEGDSWDKNGDKRGYGLAHIADKHGAELAAEGYVSREHLIKYVDEILQPGATVYVDAGNPIILTSALGMVVLEYKFSYDIGNWYSVVTAYKKRKYQGALIGTWA